MGLKEPKPIASNRARKRRSRGESKSDEETMGVDRSMPEWPPENPFERHCLEKEEVKSNDWIRLYVELALATTEDRDGDVKLKLKIVNVATDLLDEGVNAKNATFYIRYNDLSKAALGEVSDHIAIVRRRFDEDTRCFILVGQSHQSSEILSGVSQCGLARRLDNRRSV
ncbi:unnamed protein product [Brassica oleracea var. botrytis]